MGTKSGIYPTWHGWLFPIFLACLAVAVGVLVALVIYRLVGAVTF